MINRKLEITRMEALRHTKIPILPAKIKEGGKDHWVKAIALVTLANSLQEYVCIKNNIEISEYPDRFELKNESIVTASFGAMFPVVRIDEIYPYHAINANDFPPFRKKEDMVSYICHKKEFNEEQMVKVNALQKEDLKLMLYSTVI